jgi:hypothetical protein
VVQTSNRRKVEIAKPEPTGKGPYAKSKKTSQEKGFKQKRCLFKTRRLNSSKKTNNFVKILK